MTGICVTYNTAEIFKRAFESIRHFHPYLSMIIVDGSDMHDPCYQYVNTLRSDENVTVFQLGHNIGHGRGLHYGLERCETQTALLFDSDIVMLKSPLSDMLGLMTPDVYGIGWLTVTGRDGFDFGTPDRGHTEPIRYLHPYFAMINVRQYFRFHPLVHHGAPFYKTMNDLHDRRLSDSMLVHFRGLTGHTRGRGANWVGCPAEYIQHDFGGTRSNNAAHGQREIHGKWDR